MAGGTKKKKNSKGVEQERKQARMSRGGETDKGQKGTGIKLIYRANCTFSANLSKQFSF